MAVSRLAALRRSVPVTLSWLLLAGAVVAVMVLGSGRDTRADRLVDAQVVEVALALGAAALMLVTALELRGKPRRAWIIIASGVLAGAAGIALQGGAGLVVVLLLLASSALTLVGLALYLPLYTAWIGTTRRIILDSVAVSVAAVLLIMAAAEAPTLLKPGVIGGVVLLAADVGLLFATGILCLRYRAQGGPLLIFALLSVVSLFIGDLLTLGRAAMPESAPTSHPFLTLHYVLLAMAGTTSIAAPPQALVDADGPLLGAEWFVWSVTPPALGLFGLALAGSAQGVPAALTYLVIGLVFLLLLQSALDLWRVVGVLYRTRSELRQANQRLAQVEAVRASEVGQLCHDTRHHLYTIRAAVDRLAREAAAHAGRPDIARATQAEVKAALDAQHEMLSAMLDATLLSQGQLILSPEPLDLRPVVERVAREFADRCAARGAELCVRGPEGPWGVIGDDARIARVLRNLLDNAVAFLPPEDGRVVLNVHFEGEQVICEIADNGRGLEPAQLRDLRDRFAAVHRGEIPHGVTSRRSTGLGLVAVARLMSLMRGDIQIDNTSDLGSTGAVLRLAFSAAPAVRSAVVSRHQQHLLHGKHVVLVGGDHLMFEALGPILHALGAAQIVMCAAAEEVQARLARGDRIDMLVTAEVLGGVMTGTALAEWLRGQPAYARIVRVRYSMSGEQMARCVGGADTSSLFHVSLVAPVDPSVLIVALTRCLASTLPSRRVIA